MYFPVYSSVFLTCKNIIRKELFSLYTASPATKQLIRLHSITVVVIF